MKQAHQKRVFIKGYFNGNGGVDSMEVNKVVTFNEIGTDKEVENIFKGNKSNLSETDDEEEIKSKLENEFSIEGFEIVFLIK